jgi:hypothetical protein
MGSLPQDASAVKLPRRHPLRSWLAARSSLVASMQARKRCSGGSASLRRVRAMFSRERVKYRSIASSAKASFETSGS